LTGIRNHGVDEDVGYADALRRVLRKFETTEELLRFVELKH